MANSVEIYNFNCYHIPINEHLAILSRSAISPDYLIAIPLRNYKILIIKLKDNFLDRIDLNDRSILYLDIPKPQYNETEDELPPLCGDRLCTQHRNCYCAKSEHQLNSILSNRYCQENYVGVIDVDWSPIKRNFLSMLVALTSRGDAYIFNQSIFPFLTKLHDIKSYLNGKIHHLLSEFAISKNFNVTNSTIRHAKWFPYLIDGQPLLAVIIKITDNYQSFNILCILSIEEKLKIIKIVSLNTFTSCEPSLIRMSSTYMKNFHILCLAFELQPLQIFLFFDDWAHAIIPLTLSEIVTDVSVYQYSNTKLKVAIFQLNIIEIKEFKIIKVSDIPTLELVSSMLVLSRSTSCIVNGILIHSIIFYATRNGYVFTYDIDKDVHSCKKIESFKINEITMCAFSNPLSSLVFVIHTLPMTNLSFHSKDIYIDLFFFGSLNTQIKTFIKSENKDIIDKKHYISFLYRLKMCKYIFEKDCCWKNKFFSFPPKIEKIFKWRSISYIGALILKYNKKNVTNESTDEILKRILYYRVLLLYYVYHSYYIR
ncbi:hypothetical protein HZS_5274, partial [Henneguya salminicola]